MSSLYSCKSHAPGWFITKFDLDLNVLASYQVDHHSCECPRGAHPSCRHRRMLKLFLAAGHVDDGWFLDYSFVGLRPRSNALGQRLTGQTLYGAIQGTMSRPTIQSESRLWTAPLREALDAAAEPLHLRAEPQHSAAECAEERPRATPEGVSGIAPSGESRVFRIRRLI